MPKRKREDEGDNVPTAGSTTVNQRQVNQFRGTIQQCQRSLASALKLARGFERQKMGRRQKEASKEPQTLLRLREEVIILKELELDKTANNHLIKSLLRSKQVRESPVFVMVYGAGPKLEGVKSTAEGNVIGRLFNANPVKIAMTKIMKDVYSALKLEEPSKKSNGPNAKSQAPAVQAPQRRAPETTRELNPMEITDEEEADDSGQNDDLDPMQITDEEDGDEESDNQSTPSLSDDEAYSEINSSFGSTSSHPALDDRLASLSTSPEQEPTSTKSSNTRKPIKAQRTEQATSTSFLPSLAMGYYSPGSNSDTDSDEADTSQRDSENKPRKNRRGQRARQQIAEMTYGATAKHLQKPNAKGISGRDVGWDQRKGAVAGSGGRGRDGGRGRGRGRVTMRGGFHSERSGDGGAGGGGREKMGRGEKARRDDVGALHPSWEAAKLRKEKGTGMGLVKGQAVGKKVVFD